jgi:arabinogalactan endo-1,4-beta-galactosidase
MALNSTMKLFNSILVLFLFGILCCKPTAVPPSKTLSIKAVDVSMMSEMRAANVVMKNRSGQVEDMLTTLKKEGVNMIRLRLWKNPATAYSGFDDVKKLTQEIQSQGIKVWLTVHYSDNWADPAKQTKPNIWRTITYNQLKDSVYDYTKKIITDIKPDVIQIGNEINHGLLWPEGNISNPTQMVELVKQGIKAVRDNAPQTKIMIHYAGHDKAIPFLTLLNGADYDLIGLSYYPFWHGKNLDSLQTQLKAIGTQFNKDIVIAETSYPFTFDYNDATNNIIGLSNQILPEFQPTIQGQLDYLTRLKKIVVDAPKGIGFCYWGAEWVAFKGSSATNGSTWENQALWNFDNKAVPAMSVFKD